MSSLATASERRRASAAARVRRHVTPDIALGALVATGLGVLAFVTTGGTDLGPNTWAEIALIVLGSGLFAAAALFSAARGAWGTTSLLLFAGLAAWTAASVAWSVQPADSWIEAGRTTSYLAAFAGAFALARLMPTRWSGVLGSIAALTVVVSAYALLVKVFPATFDATATTGRLRLPFDYFNAVGQLAALGVPVWVWIGARREGGVLTRALAVPALGVLSTTIVLSYSRGAIVIAAIGLAVWFALVPLRLRAAMMLGLGVLGGVLASAWAIHERPVSHDNFALASRTSAGHKFGLVLIVLVAIQTIVGLAVATRTDRVTITETTRRRLGKALIALVVVVGVAGLGTAAATGNVSKAWNQLTSPNSGGAGNNPSRILATGSSRGRYWNEGLKVGEHALLKGAGADGFATAHLRYYASAGSLAVEHAHSYWVQTFADLGLIGLALSLALLAAWCKATAQTVDFRRRGPPSAERIGLITLLATVLVFGLGSAIDWTWFIPGVTVPALICAGWLAGRGPPDQASGATPRPRFGAPAAILMVTATAAVVLLIAWTIFQPLRSANADAAALAAATKGDTAVALADARTAANENPVSVDPLFELAALYHASGEDRAALAELDRAIARQPDNPATWDAKWLLLYHLGRRRAALAVLERAARLNRNDLGALAYLRAHPNAQLK